MYLTKHELELVLQLDGNLPGNVATVDPVNIWEHLRVAGLYQWVAQPNEAQVPQWNGSKGTHIFTH